PVLLRLRTDITQRNPVTGEHLDMVRECDGAGLAVVAVDADFLEVARRRLHLYRLDVATASSVEIAAPAGSPDVGGRLHQQAGHRSGCRPHVVGDAVDSRLLNCHSGPQTHSEA